MLITKALSLCTVYVTPEEEIDSRYDLVRITHAPEVTVTTFGRLRLKGCGCTVVSTKLQGKQATWLIADYPSVLSAEIGHVKWSKILLSPKTTLIPEIRYLKITSYPEN